MSVLGRLVRVLGFRNMVRVDGKGFHDLSLPETAEMIDVYLGRAGRLEPGSLYEFYTVPNAGALERVRQRLLTIQSDFAEANEPDGLSTEGGRIALEALAEELRRGVITDS